MRNEIWKPIEGYDSKYKYEVSNLGNVRKWWHRGKVLTEPRLIPQCDNNHGYLIVDLMKNGKQEHPKVHRLVAIVFIPNPLNKRTVNHINEVKTDNRVENLEWSTDEEQVNYGTRNKRVSKSLTNGKTSKPIIGTNKITGYIIEFPSTQEVERQLGIYHSSITNCCKGKQQSSGGYYWKYKEEL